MINFIPYQEKFDVIGKHKDNVTIINNFVNSQDLKIITDYLNTKTDDDEFLGGKDLRLEVVKLESPEVGNLVINYEEKIYEEIVKAFTTKHNVKVVRKPINPTHFVKWAPGMSSGLHADCETHDGKPAEAANFYKYNISVLVYPNDNYDGGEITFPDYGIVLKPKAGDLIIFPGNSYYKHTVEVVKSGIRYTMPSWYSFDVSDTTPLMSGSYLDSGQLWPDSPDRDLVGDKTRDSYINKDSASG
jgi:hypothetical protein